MKKTDQTGTSTLKKVKTAFWGMTIFSIVAYIAYAVVGIISYKKLGRYPGFDEYIANIFNFHEPVRNMKSAYDYITDPTLLISILFGIRLMMIGYRYKIDTNDNKLLAVYSLFAVSSVINAMKGFYYINDKLPAMLRLASPFALAGSAVLSVIFSLKLRKTIYSKWLFYSFITEIFRIIGLSLVMDISAVGIKQILKYAALMSIMCVFMRFNVGTAPAIGSSSPRSNAKEKAKLLEKIDNVKRDRDSRITALKKHNRGDIGYGYVDNKAMTNKIKSLDKDIEIYNKQLEKL